MKFTKEAWLAFWAIVAVYGLVPPLAVCWEFFKQFGLWPWSIG